MLTVGSLFSGIGGIERGLERTGHFKTVWQIENDPYATRVLEQHWPNARRWGDVRTFPPDTDEQQPQDGRQSKAPSWDSKWHVDLICGGFPCQDISYAGKGAGLGGERSGLFYEAARIIRVLEPRYVLLENVAALLGRGIGDVLGTLASLGYDAEWHCIPAAAVGAPHIRDRVFIVGYAQQPSKDAYAQAGRSRGSACESSGDVGYPNEIRLPRHNRRWTGKEFTDGCWWAVEPSVCELVDGTAGRLVRYAGRTAHKVPNRVDKLRCLGNAVVPQVAEFIGHRVWNHWNSP